MGQDISYPDPRILSAVKSQIDSTPILVVSKSGCNACIKAKQLLNQLAVTSGVAPSIFEIDSYGLRHKKAIMKHLSARTGVKTVPQIWINGRFVGGNDDIQQLHRAGQLSSLMRRNTMGSQTVQDSFGQTTSTLRITPFKADVIPFPFAQHFPHQINKRNQSTITNRSTWNRSRSSAKYSSFEDRDYISSVPKTYMNDDYKQEPVITGKEQSSSGFYQSSRRRHSMSSVMEVNFNRLRSTNQSFVSNAPINGKNVDLITDGEILAASWV